MKLRNKKTGEIDNWCIDKDVIRTCSGSIVYNSLADLNEEWEDYEEPKEYWYISSDSVIYATDYGKYPDSDLLREEIGNYFETKEEAEKAVKKLKAWKRLKDKGFRFDKWVNVSGDGCSRPIWFYFSKDTELEGVKPDLDLLFGGEE